MRFIPGWTAHSRWSAPGVVNGPLTPASTHLQVVHGRHLLFLHQLSASIAPTAVGKDRWDYRIIYQGERTALAERHRRLGKVHILQVNRRTRAPLSVLARVELFPHTAIVRVRRLIR